MATQQTPFIDGDPSTTTTQARDVPDEIRNLIPEYASILALVSKGKVMDGKVTEQKGLISKESADQPRVEAFTHLPPEFMKTATAVSSLDITFANVLDVYVRMVYQNTANNHVGIVSAINSNVVTFTAISAAFTVAVGDELMRCANAYEEGSSDPAYLQKGDDNVYNTLQIVRFPVEITGSSDTTRHLAGGDYLTRMKKYSAIEGMRDVERAALFGERAASGNSTAVTIGGAAKNIRTTRGMWNFAQATFDAGGNMTPQKLRRDLPNAMHESVGSVKDVIMYTSSEFVSIAVEWQQQYLRIDQSKELKKFGIKAHKFETSKMTIHMVPHDAFNRGGNQTKALCIIPEQWRYRFKKGRDLQPKKGLQSNSTDGFKDEIIGEVGFLPLDGGYSTTTLTNLY